MRRPVTVCSGGLLCLMVLLASSSRADEEQVHLRYRARGPCVSRDAFVALVAARTGRARWIRRDQGVRAFEVTVEGDPEQGEGYGQAVGTLVIRDIDGQVFRRRVESDSCADVVDALALVTALAIDPKARVTPAPAPSTPLPEDGPAGRAPTEPASPAAPDVPPGPSGSPPSPPVSPPEGIGPLGPTPAPAPAPTSYPPATSWPPPTVPWVPPAPPPLRTRWRWTLGLSPRAASGLGTWSFVLPIYLDVSLQTHELLAPSFRLAVSALPSRTIDEPEGSAELFRIAGHLNACPIKLKLWKKVAFRPCIGAELGALHSSGHVVPEQEATALWLAVAAPFRLQWIPLDWALLELQGEIGVPLIRQRYYFEPDRTVLEVDSVFGTLGAGVGVRFP